MTDIVMGYCASHAPMMSADKKSAPPDQAECFFGALAKVAEESAAARPQAIVFMTGEHSEDDRAGASGAGRASVGRTGRRRHQPALSHKLNSATGS